MFANASAKGAWAEAQAVADLLHRGYEVFQAVSASATCDLIILSQEQAPLRIEVRMAHRHVSTYAWQVAVPDRSRFDHLCIVCPDGGIHYDPPLDDIQTVVFQGMSVFQILGVG